MAGKKKPHHIRPLKHPVGKIHVRADCDNCSKWETVTMYEDEVENRDFKTSFYECEKCRNMFCSVCYPDQKEIKCPFCAKTKSVKIRPFDIYMCNVCLDEWFHDRLCAKCKYEKKE